MTIAKPSAAGLPDEAMLARMATELFRGGDLAAPALAPGALSQAHPLHAEPPGMALPDPHLPTSASQLPSSAPVSLDLSQPALPGQPPVFQVPQEVALLPEPAELFKAMNPPDFPRTPPVPTSTMQPYWLEGKQHAAALERTLDLSQFAAPGFELEPTRIFANVPDKPPEKLPETPPAKDFFINKIKAMSGQHWQDAAPAPAPAAAPARADLPYWLPQAALPAEPAVPQPATVPLAMPTQGFDVESVRKDFPILRQTVHGKPLVWLDNAATTQKPQTVIDRLVKFYQEENSNVHRTAHAMAGRATDAYEAAREKVRRFLGASSTEEIIFTRGTTESINLVAQTWARQHLGAGDEIILIEYEHHSNIVPWQHITREKGARIRVVPIFDNGEIDLNAYERLFNARTKMVSLGHVSNALGTVAPLKDMIATAHRHGCVACVDAAQSSPHFPINVQDLDADFLAISGHKLFAPTGVGVLYGKKRLLEQMPPWQGGGNMIVTVSFEQTVYAGLPNKLEAGTGILAGAVGLGAAIDYLERIGFANAARYEEDLLHYAQDAISQIPGVRMIGTARHKAGVLSFVTDKLTPGQLGQILDAEGIAVRTGHHCAQPALAHFGLKETVRPSIAFYNTRAEIDLLVRTVDQALRALR
ncbi:cysteine desulfurase [Massilia sp. TS11]|uniref:cysteine desulfurase n=1 Tax=Massilia sp. TS11 TaxID=2908003 RepID=UPI001EDA5CCB|nr:cysteine desulfurase [Massilia sp. TS11]MCG2583057.1 SufS family cysteine desulfurase [Massilia sp. TS11]